MGFQFEWSADDGTILCVHRLVYSAGRFEAHGCLITDNLVLRGVVMNGAAAGAATSPCEICGEPMLAGWSDEKLRPLMAHRLVDAGASDSRRAYSLLEGCRRSGRPDTAGKPDRA